MGCAFLGSAKVWERHRVSWKSGFRFLPAFFGVGCEYLRLSVLEKGDFGRFWPGRPQPRLGRNWPHFGQNRPKWTKSKTSEMDSSVLAKIRLGTLLRPIFGQNVQHRPTFGQKGTILAGPKNSESKAVCRPLKLAHRVSLRVSWFGLQLILIASTVSLFRGVLTSRGFGQISIRGLGAYFPGAGRG